MAAITHELKEGTLCFTPTRASGEEPCLSLVVAFEANDTGARYVRLYSAEEVVALEVRSPAHPEVKPKRIFAADPEALLEIIRARNRIVELNFSEDGMYVDFTVRYAIGNASRDYLVTLMAPRVIGGEGSEAAVSVRDFEDLRRHNRALALRCSTLEGRLARIEEELWRVATAVAGAPLPPPSKSRRRPRALPAPLLPVKEPR